MGKLTAAESWFGRVGLMRGRGRKKKSSSAAESEKGTIAIGVLAFEVGSLMSKIVHLWHSLADDQMVRLRDDALHLEGIRKLVSHDDDFLLGLALAEVTDSLGSLARSVSRLGKRCTDPVLQRFEHVFTDLINRDADLFGFQYAGKKMERKVKKMERFVAASSNLYQELEVLAELEQSLRRMQVQANSDPTRRSCLTDFKHKVLWQRQEVKGLRDSSLWNRSYDYTIRLLARSLFTIVGRIKHVFGLQHHNHKEADDSRAAANVLSRSRSVTGPLHSSIHPSEGGGITRLPSGVPPALLGTRSGPIGVTDGPIGGLQHQPPSIPQSLPSWKRRHLKKTKWPVSSKPFGGCMVAGSDSPVLQSCMPMDSGCRRPNAVLRTLNGTEDADPVGHFCGNIFTTTHLSLSLFEPRRKLLNAPPSTLGAAALALHYANIIIVVEKLVTSLHLIGPDARDDLYSMLPTSIRTALRARLKSYAKNLTSSVYDPILAAEWSEALTRILDWLTPLAHNMIKWQSERNFEQQHLVSSTNVLLLQTLYFANQAKTEAAITELLVGLNYLWRFGRELSAKAMLECDSSRNFDDYLESKG